MGVYLWVFFGISDEDTVNDIYQHMLSAPVNYLEYYVGYLELRHMKEQAQKALGTKFHLKEFHQFILDLGPAPFTVIKPYFNEWMNGQKAGK